MNRITIPVLLTVIVMIAGVFAFMPVEQAITVHTSGETTIAQAGDITNILEDTNTTLPANIEDQRRGLYFNTHVTTAVPNIVLVPLATDEAFSAHVVLSSSGVGACELQTDGNLILLTGVANGVITAILTNENAGSKNPDTFLNTVDIELDTPADTECSVTMVVTQFE